MWSLVNRWCDNLHVKIRLPFLLAVVPVLVLVTWTPSIHRRNDEAPQAQPANDIAFEAAQTAKLLGVPVQNFPAPQRLTDFDELPASAPAFTLTAQQRSGAPPRVWFDPRPIVTARAPDETSYEALCGSDDDSQIVPGHGFVSDFENRRQYYDPHHGYGYMPQNIYVGKRELGRLKPSLFFRDVGSHTTAPHYLAIDSQGQVHLAVADVNISQGNRLDLYWVFGDPKTGKWNSAWLIDRRGFTSWSHPWIGAWSDKVQLIWDWCDVSINKRAPGMGAFHVEWSSNGFGKKTRIFGTPISASDAAIDQQTGLLVIIVARVDGGVYALSRTAEGKWTRPSLLVKKLSVLAGVSVEATKNGAFIVRAGSENAKEWLLRPGR